MTQSQLEPENLEQSELEYSFFLSNIPIPIRNIHIPTSLKLSIQYSIFRFQPRHSPTAFDIYSHGGGNEARRR